MMLCMSHKQMIPIEISQNFTSVSKAQKEHKMFLISLKKYWKNKKNTSLT